MSIKRVVALASTALFAVALAGPAAASGDVFTHEGEPIESGSVSASFSGPVSMNFAAAPTEGSHCSNVHFAVDLEAEGEGSVTGVAGTGCKTTSAEPAKNGLPVDLDQINVNKWKLMIDAKNSLIFLTNYHITNTVTHPVTTHLVIAKTTVQGDLVELIPPGQTNAIETVELSDEGATIEQGNPPGPPALSANVSGDLTSNGTVGIAE